jgi:hypothetical protein
MTSQEFIIWLKGFVSAAHDYTPTPKQWETLKEQLAEVDDNIIPMGGVIVDNNTFKTWAENDKRMDVIGQNGNEGTHYDKEEFDDYGQRIPSPKWTSTSTNEVDDEFELGGSE